MDWIPNRHLLITGVKLDILGAGRHDATVEGIEPVRLHGAPGLLWRVRLRLADGSTLTGRCAANGRIWFDDPRVSVAGSAIRV